MNSGERSKPQLRRSQEGTGLSPRGLAGDSYLEQERRQERCDLYC